MDDVVFRLLRELPDTDKDRYDIAYERGRAQARSSLLFGGMAIGLLAGALGLFLLDPVVGGGRRADSPSERRQSARPAADGRRPGRDVRNRALGAATELGLPGTPQSNVERREAAAATTAALPRHAVRTPPRSAAASVARRDDGRDRVPVAAGTAER